MLSVSPSRYNATSDDRIDSGMEMATINVLRQLPRNSKIMAAVNNPAIKPSIRTPLIDARTKTD